MTRKPATLAAAAAAALVISFTLPPSRVQAAPQLTPAQRKQVGDWQVISFAVKDEGEIPGARAVGVIPRPPEQVLFALLGIDRYRFWVPHLKGSRFVKKSQWPTRGGYAVLESKLPWPARDAWAYIQFSWEPLGGRRYRMRWWMRNGNLKAYRGWAEVAPFTGDAAHTLVHFEVHMMPKTSAPRSIVRKGIRKTSEVYVHRLRMRIEALNKYKKFPADLTTRYRKN
ncbi:MAG: hypothetical protein KC503_29115 [Myxococcales bacterium]|nr:hypothetical protein [Myxococcales bacterium]